jgi:membrane-associated protein
MGYRRFMLFNIAGGLLWIWSMLLTGYFLGRYIPGAAQRIELVIIIVVALSLMPGVIAWARARRMARAAHAAAHE